MGEVFWSFPGISWSSLQDGASFGYFVAAWRDLRERGNFMAVIARECCMGVFPLNIKRYNSYLLIKRTDN